jgi:Protein of unknown function (DUF2905)
MAFQFGKLLVILGIVIVAVGILLMAGSRFPSLGVGKLPGDIAIKGKNWSFYFPIVTCFIISLVVTLIIWVVNFLTKR